MSVGAMYGARDGKTAYILLKIKPDNHRSNTLERVLSVQTPNYEV
jgi:hypothetical protein